MAADGSKQLPYLPERELRRCASTYIYSTEHGLRPKAHLLAQRVGILLALVEQGGGVEPTVYAPALAERDVYI